MSLKGLAFKIYLLALATVPTYWIFYSIPKMAPEKRHLGQAISAFIILFLLTEVVFGAKVQPTEEGLKVEQWVNTFVNYREITGCYSFFLPPLRLVILTTQQSFPLKILFTGDKLDGPSRPLFQDGRLALQVKSKMGSQPNSSSK